jgi:hypothetical protein
MNCNPPGYHVFNIGTGEGVSVFELIRAFEKVPSSSSPPPPLLPPSFSSPLRSNLPRLVATRSITRLVPEDSETSQPVTLIRPRHVRSSAGERRELLKSLVRTLGDGNLTILTDTNELFVRF